MYRRLRCMLYATKTESFLWKGGSQGTFYGYLKHRISNQRTGPLLYSGAGLQFGASLLSAANPIALWRVTQLDLGFQRSVIRFHTLSTNCLPMPPSSIAKSRTRSRWKVWLFSESIDEMFRQSPRRLPTMIRHRAMIRSCAASRDLTVPGMVCSLYST